MPALPMSLVKDNIEDLSHIPVLLGQTTELSGPEPGDRQDVIYDVVPGNAELTVLVIPGVTAACQPIPVAFRSNPRRTGKVRHQLGNPEGTSRIQETRAASRRNLDDGGFWVRSE